MCAPPPSASPLSQEPLQGFRLQPPVQHPSAFKRGCYGTLGREDFLFRTAPSRAVDCHLSLSSVPWLKSRTWWPYLGCSHELGCAGSNLTRAHHQLLELPFALDHKIGSIPRSQVRHEGWSYGEQRASWSCLQPSPKSLARRKGPPASLPLTCPGRPWVPVKFPVLFTSFCIYLWMYNGYV